MRFTAFTARYELEKIPMTVQEQVREQVMTLRDDQAREVLDFIGYLKQKPDRDEWDDLMRAQEKSLAAVWDNDSDDVWNDL